MRAKIVNLKIKSERRSYVISCCGGRSCNNAQRSRLSSRKPRTTTTAETEAYDETTEDGATDNTVTFIFKSTTSSIPAGSSASAYVSQSAQTNSSSSTSTGITTSPTTLTPSTSSQMITTINQSTYFTVNTTSSSPQISVTSNISTINITDTTLNSTRNFTASTEPITVNITMTNNSSTTVQFSTGNSSTTPSLNITGSTVSNTTATSPFTNTTVMTSSPITNATTSPITSTTTVTTTSRVTSTTVTTTSTLTSTTTVTTTSPITSTTTVTISSPMTSTTTVTKTSPLTSTTTVTTPLTSTTTVTTTPPTTSSTTVTTSSPMTSTTTVTTTSPLTSTTTVTTTTTTPITSTTTVTTTPPTTSTTKATTPLTSTTTLTTTTPITSTTTVTTTSPLTSTTTGTTTTPPSTTSTTTMTTTTVTTTTTCPYSQCYTNECVGNIKELADATNATKSVNSTTRSPSVLTLTYINGKNYYIDPNNRQTYFGALMFCRDHGMDLATINNQTEQNAITKLLKEIGRSNTFVFLSGNKIGTCPYQWIDGSPMTYQNWNPGDPAQSDSENCMLIWNGKWFDSPCNLAEIFICEQKAGTNISTTPCPYVECKTPDCIDDIQRKTDAVNGVPYPSRSPSAIQRVLVNGKNYHFVKTEVETWFNALKFCRTYGMELAKLNSQTEFNAIITYLQSINFGTGIVFTGGNKIGLCKYRWLDGTDMAYQNWNIGAPDQTSTANCICIYNGKYDDSPCNSAANFICE